MAYTLWLKIEGDEDRDGTDEGWTSLVTRETRKEIEIEGDRARKLLGNAGFATDYLEGWHANEPD